MSDKHFREEGIEKANSPSVSENVILQGQKSDSPVFYRCTCPNCGKDALELHDSGVFLRCDLLGVTGEADIGCGSLELAGACERAIQCWSCGHRIYEEASLDPDRLLEWARTHGKATNPLEFTCPVCGSHQLDQVEIEVERRRPVMAVYEIVENSEKEDYAEVALRCNRIVLGRESFRYRCTKGHELAKNDGSPVETGQELVEWLKTYRPSVKE